MSFNEIILSIESGTFTDDQISLNASNLTNVEGQRLSEALRNNPDVAKKIITIELKTNQLTSFSVPDTLTQLKNLELSSNQLTSFSVPDTLTQLRCLKLMFNQLTSFSVPDTLTKLQWLLLNGNQLTSVSLPDTLIGLERLNLYGNQLTSFSLPDTLTNLESASLANNQLSSFNVPDTLIKLKYLLLNGNRLIRFNLPDTLTGLERLCIDSNQLTSFSVPDTLTKLQWLLLNGNRLTSFSLPDTLIELRELNLSGNQLTSFSLPDTLVNLQSLTVSRNPLADASRIALLAFFPNVSITNIHGPVELTSEMLREHFIRVRDLMVANNFATERSELKRDLREKKILYLETAALIASIKYDVLNDDGTNNIVEALLPNDVAAGIVNCLLPRFNLEKHVNELRGMFRNQTQHAASIAAIDNFRKEALILLEAAAPTIQNEIARRISRNAINPQYNAFLRNQGMATLSTHGSSPTARLG